VLIKVRGLLLTRALISETGADYERDHDDIRRGILDADPTISLGVWVRVGLVSNGPA
jgi:hypothetical protein